MRQVIRKRDQQSLIPNIASDFLFDLSGGLNLKKNANLTWNTNPYKVSEQSSFGSLISNIASDF